MAKIIAVRHAESIANTKGIYQGQTYDTPLSSLGKKQALALAKELKNYKIDKIVASPLKRTMQTAQIISSKIGLSLQKEKAVIETNHGRWEGQKKEWIYKNYPTVSQTWAIKPASAVFPEGEAFTDTVDRVGQFIFCDEWKGNTLLVTHDNIVRIIICLANNIFIDKMWDIDLDPASISIFKIKGINGKKKLETMKTNNTLHLRGLKSDLSMHAL